MLQVRQQPQEKSSHRLKMHFSLENKRVPLRQLLLAKVRETSRFCATLSESTRITQSHRRTQPRECPAGESECPAVEDGAAAADASGEVPSGAVAPDEPGAVEGDVDSSSTALEPGSEAPLGEEAEGEGKNMLLEFVEEFVVAPPRAVTGVEIRVCTGQLPEAHTDSEAFFFLRSSVGKIAIESLEKEVECGMLSEGPSLKMLEQVREILQPPLLLSGKLSIAWLAEKTWAPLLSPHREDIYLGMVSNQPIFKQLKSTTIHKQFNHLEIASKFLNP